jgi:polysaccharide export outer membrane protein
MTNMPRAPFFDATVPRRQGVPTRACTALLLSLSLLGTQTGGMAQDVMRDGGRTAASSFSLPSSAGSLPSVSVAPISPTSTVAYTTSMAVLNDSAKLGPGDRVSFRVVEEKRDPIGLIVTDSGEMEVPLIGRVAAANKTCKQLAYEIKPVLEKEYFYQATVIIGLDMISTKSRGKVYLTGQVRTQGALELMPDEVMTVSKTILRAGGLADFAEKRKVKLVRRKADGTSETTLVDLDLIIKKGQLDKDPVVQPGDLIVVPERLINF